jgi:hypothetical protein
MPRPRGIKETKPRKQIAFIPGEAGWNRIHRSNHYLAKGLSLENFKLIASQPCHYCGEPPRLFNPFGVSFEHYLATWRRPCHRDWWDGQWIKANGVDKMTHQEDYKDLSNLVPCCSTCNYMKHRVGHDEFIAHCKKVAAHK